VSESKPEGEIVMNISTAPHPFEDSDVFIIIDTLGEFGADKVLFQNAYDFYFQKSA
jgi:hypothetical protein